MIRRLRKQSNPVKPLNRIVDSGEIVKISEGPKEIREWIDTLNLLPKDRNAAAAQFVRTWKKHETNKGISDKGNSEYRQFLGRRLADRIDTIAGGLSVTDMFMAVSRLYTEKETVVFVVESFQKWEHLGRPVTHLEFHLGEQLITLTFNPDTSLNVPSFRALQLLTTPIRISKKKTIPFPAERVRICPICEHIHWASRKDAQTCGKKSCVNTLGNQKRSKKKKAKEGR